MVAFSFSILNIQVIISITIFCYLTIIIALFFTADVCLLTNYRNILFKIKF